MKDIIKYIKDENTFLITSHASPDGDNVGSCLGMLEFLTKIGKEAYYVLDDSFPQNLSFLYENYKIYESEEIKELLKERSYSLIALDCGDIKRLKIEPDLIEGASLICNIDHHKSNNNFGTLNYVVDDASSTSELVYNIFCAVDENLIDEKIGIALYTGLVTDTGNFMFESAKDSSLIMAAKLLSKGVDKQKIIRNIYQSNSFDYLKLTAEVMMTLEKEKHFSYMILESSMLKKHSIDYNDTEGLVNHALNIDGVEVGVLFKEQSENVVKVSFRSKGWANVNEIAKAFNGGGHERAAGCTINKPIDQAVYSVLEKLREYMKIHGRSN